VEVEVEAPTDGLKPRVIRCAGIVVQCEASPRHAGYDITLLFMELNKRALAELGKISRHQAAHAAAHRNTVVGFRV
jgi:hypothetical protein